jgi:tetratricopeptide (TPR) repeat protein
MKREFLTLVVLLAAIVTGRAQTIILKDGSTVAALSVRRDGNTVMATVPLQGTTGTAGLAKPVDQITRIAFPEPPQIGAANKLVAQGNAADALAQLDPVIAQQAPFRDIAGNFWGQAALVKLYALLALNRDAEVESLATDLAKFANDPELGRAGQVQLAAAVARKGNFKRALEVLDPIVKTSDNPGVLADAWVKKGNAHFGLKQYELALRAYFRIPVFYPDNKAVRPAATLGMARAFAQLEDFDRSKAAYNELITQFPSSAEATAAQTELKRTEEFEQEKMKGKSKG